MKLHASIIRAMCLAAVLAAPLLAQTPSTSAPSSSAQASDDMTKKITDLVHAGRYAEAQQLTTGLLVAYPDDQRLIKAKALIDQLLASTPANPAAQPTPAPVPPDAEELTGMDKVDYNALVELAREAQQATDPVDQEKLLNQFMSQSESFLQKHPKQSLLWQLRAACAIALNQPLAGYDAGQRLLATGAADSNDPNVQRILGQLRNKGWLNLPDAQALQATADKERTQKHEADERLRNTFPVVHAKVGFGSNGYGYGHITFTAEGAVYEGSDETIRIKAADIKKATAECNVDSCGMLFHPNGGRRYFFLPVTEEAVMNRSDKGKIFLKAYVLGNAVIRRWGFVKADNKTLIPPPGGFVPKAPNATPAASAPTVKPVPAPSAPPALLPVPESQPSTAATPQVNPAAPISIQPVTPNTSSAPTSDKAILHLYRLSHFAGSGLKPHVTLDGTEITQVSSGHAMQAVIEPGKHTIGLVERRAKVDNSALELNMEAGKEYWIRITLESGFVYHVKLDLLVPEMASAEAAKLQQAELNPPRKK